MLLGGLTQGSWWDTRQDLSSPEYLIASAEFVALEGIASPRCANLNE